MAQPGMPGSQFPGEDDMSRRVKDLERAVQQLRTANQLGAAGIRAVEGGIVVDGSETINGPLVVNGVSGFNGPLSIMGALTLQPGIIGNDALANPLTTGSAGFTASNQTFSTTAAVYGTQNIVVPDGFTQALVMNGVSSGATNSTPGDDYIYVSASINDVPGGETPTYAVSGYYGSASAFAIRALTGLTSGSNITVGVRVRTGSGTWAAAAANIANVNALALFYR